MLHRNDKEPRAFLIGLLLAFAAGTSAASADEPGTAASGDAFVDFQPARVVESTRPGFPRSGHRPKLVAYPGMRASERAGEDWTPEHGIWTLPIRVQLDAAGRPVAVRVDDHPLRSQGMVRRYERLALRAVEDWRYAPARIDGRAVASEVIVPFHFDTALGQPLWPSEPGTLPATRSAGLTYRAIQRVTNR